MTKNKTLRGFTLIEITITLILIGVLILIANLFTSIIFSRIKELQDIANEKRNIVLLNQRIQEDFMLSDKVLIEKKELKFVLNSKTINYKLNPEMTIRYSNSEVDTMNIGITDCEKTASAISNELILKLAVHFNSEELFLLFKKSISQCNKVQADVKGA